MQYIATSKPTIAAGALPIDIGNSVDAATIQDAATLKDGIKDDIKEDAEVFQGLLTNAGNGDDQPSAPAAAIEQVKPESTQDTEAAPDSERVDWVGFVERVISETETNEEFNDFPISSVSLPTPLFSNGKPSLSEQGLTAPLPPDFVGATNFNHERIVDDQAILLTDNEVESLLQANPALSNLPAKVSTETNLSDSQQQDTIRHLAQDLVNIVDEAIAKSSENRVLENVNHENVESAEIDIDRRDLRERLLAALSLSNLPASTQNAEVAAEITSKANTQSINAEFVENTEPELTLRTLSDNILEADIQNEQVSAVNELANVLQITEIENAQPIAEADIALVTEVLTSYSTDNNQTDNPVASPSALVNSPVSVIAELEALNQNTLDAAIDSVLNVVPESSQRTATLASLRADISSAAAELTTRQQQNSTAELSLQDIVEQAVSSDNLAISEELQVGLSQQAGRAEQLIAVAQSVVDSVVRQQAGSGINAVETSATAALSEATVVGSLDNLASENVAQLSERQKLQNPIPADRAVPLQNPEGQKQVAEKIRWMVGARVQAAEIRLDPPELGSMQIRISMAGDTASVNFIVQSTHAKEMLADAQSQLHDMLSEQGIDLGESFVATQDEQQDAENDDANNGQVGQRADNQTEDAVVTEQVIKQNQSPYNVDAYV